MNEDLVLILDRPETESLVLSTMGDGTRARIYYDTTDGWNQKPTYVPPLATIVVYTDRNVTGSVNYPGVKLGDGTTCVSDLPFVGDDVAAQILSVVNGKLDASEKGQANGVAELDGSGKVPTSQLPSYVDDVIEGYFYEEAFYSDEEHTVLISGEFGKIYDDLPTGDIYRWGGSSYAKINDPESIIDDASGEGSTNKTWSADKLAKQAKNVVPFGRCTTETDVAAKEVTIDGIDSLYDGLTIRVWMSNGNSADVPTLNLNGLGATAIRVFDWRADMEFPPLNTDHFASPNVKLFGLPNNSVVTLTYIVGTGYNNRTAWVVNDQRPNIPYAVFYGSWKVSGSNNQYAVLCDGFIRNNHTYFVLLLQNDISAANGKQIQLTVNNTASCNVYFNGELAKAPAGSGAGLTFTIPAGVYIVYYNDSKYYLRNDGMIPGDIEKVNGHTVEKDVPSDAVFTDTTYSPATQSADGLMSSTDKTKLDGMTVATTTETQAIIDEYGVSA